MNAIAQTHDELDAFDRPTGPVSPLECRIADEVAELIRARHPDAAEIEQDFATMNAEGYLPVWVSFRDEAGALKLGKHYHLYPEGTRTRIFSVDGYEPGSHPIDMLALTPGNRDD